MTDYENMDTAVKKHIKPVKGKSLSELDEEVYAAGKKIKSPYS